ncbi:MAG: ABC transporter substrate-binding protein [Deltaproteobacteria bacterium]|nr:ABC transporter substrate-binding protein [Candidatus Zymogenaceae bacterium]
MCRKNAVLYIIMAMVLSCALILGACDKGTEAPDETAPTGTMIDESLDPYVIGGVFSITGRASFLGEPERNSMELFSDIVNENGGINGHKLEVIIYDDEGDPTNTVINVKKLIEKDNVLAIVGPSLSGNTLGVIDTVEEKEVPLISCAASIKITSPVKPWVFKTPQTDEHAVEKIYEYLANEGIKKIAIITVSNGYGDSGKEQLKSQAEEAGVTIVAEESYGEEDSDMTAQLTNIKGTDAEAIVCWGTNPGPAIIAKNIVQLGIELPLIQSHGVASPSYIEYAGDASNGNILPTGKILIIDQLPKSDVQYDALKEYRELYEAAYESEVSGFGGYAWDAMGIIALALETSGADRAALRDAIEGTTDFVGVSGVFNMSPEDHTGLTKDAFVIVVIEDGGWKIVE